MHPNDVRQLLMIAAYLQSEAGRADRGAHLRRGPAPVPEPIDPSRRWVGDVVTCGCGRDFTVTPKRSDTCQDCRVRHGNLKSCGMVA